MIVPILIFIIFLGILLLVHEAGHFFAAKAFKVKVKEFGLGYPPKLWGKKMGDTEYSINWLPFGGFVKILGEDELGKDNKSEAEKDSLLSKKPWKKFVIMAAGIVMNFVFGVIFLSIGYMIGLPVLSDGTQAIENTKLSILEVVDDSPASIAQLEMGDVILKVQSSESFIESPISVSNFQSFVKEHVSEELTLTIEKANKEIVDKSILARANPPEGEGAIGIAIGEVGVVKYSFFDSIGRGIKSGGQIFLGTFKVLGKLIKGIFVKGDSVGNLVGPIGIAVMGGQTVQLGLGYLLQFLAGLSINLAVLNLLPIPALDGGRILFIIIEKIIRRPISPKLEGNFHLVGLVLIIALSIFVAVRDVIKLF